MEDLGGLADDEKRKATSSLAVVVQEGRPRSRPDLVRRIGIDPLRDHDLQLEEWVAPTRSSSGRRLA